MKAKGYIITTKFKKVDYFFKPTENKWVKDIKQIAIGDIYFTDLVVKLYMGDSPKSPSAEDFPLLDYNLWERKEFTIETNII